MFGKISHFNLINLYTNSNFFDGIDLPIGDLENKAIGARNFAAHGSINESKTSILEQHKLAMAYETLISRVILKLIGYSGNYVDYGTLGYPERDINCPVGGDFIAKDCK